MEEPEIKFIAKAMSKKFQNPNRIPGACACLGINSCDDVGCYAWWEQFLRYATLSDMSFMARLLIALKQHKEEK